MVKVEVLSNFISEYGQFTKGQIIGVNDEKRLRAWIESGLVRVVKPQPGENKMHPGPGENKSGNSFGAPTTGPSTATPSSSAPGPATPSSASPEAASTQTRSRRSRGGGNTEGGGGLLP